jgi:ATP-dependent helicase/nuclease subunit A
MNVWKLRDLMAAQAAMPQLSFSGWVHRLVDCLMTHPPEPEASLEEESLDAVRVLSIHKAKGLEFPVVILPGLHQKSTGMDRGAEVTVDWMSGVYGCTFPPTWNTGQVLLWEKERIREKAEQRRVMYVGMTRARDRLILSGGQLTKPIGESFLGFLQHVADSEVGNPEHATVQIGEAAIRQTVVTSRHLPPSQRVIPSAVPETSDRKGEGTASFETYHERERAWHQASKEVDFITPSLLQRSRAKRIHKTQPGGLKLPGQYLGTLVHRLLEQWDFHLYPENFLQPLRKFCLKELPSDLDDDEKNAFMLEIEDLMGNFLQSASYRELQQATVHGREVPFAMPWSHQGQAGSKSYPCVMEGVMDVVYAIAGDVWVGDYKTDRVSAAQVGNYAQVYHQQAQVYAMAASRSLGLNVKGCKLVFLRIGEMVSIMTDVNKCL